MEELKQHQPPLTIDEQIENLKNIGLIVEDEEYARKILNDISYFRLIKAYSLNLKPKNGNYGEKVTFENIVELYLFNANFRQVIFPEIEKIEINVRCRVANYFVEQYGVLGYLDADNFANPDYHQIFMNDIEEEIKRNAKAPDKKAVAKVFGVGYTYLESWLESVFYVRNICAHYGRLYNAKLSKTPILYKEYSSMGIGNNRIFGVLLCLRTLLRNDTHWNLFVDKVEMLFDKYENVDINTMGFPKNWKMLLEIK